MTTKYSRDEILAGIREELVECIAVEPEEVTPAANFFHDLGGESIDLLDLSFRSEKRFGLQAPFKRLASPENWQIDPSGHPSRETLLWLTSEFPKIDWEERLSGTTFTSPKDLLTVDLIVELLVHAPAVSTSAAASSTNRVA